MGPVWVLALPPWAPSFPRPRAKAVSVLLSGPGVQRHSGCRGHPACHRCQAPISPAPRGLEPQACTPRELDWGPGEVCVAKITVKPFTQLSGKVPRLCLTRIALFLPQLGDEKIQGLQVTVRGLRLHLYFDNPPPREPWPLAPFFWYPDPGKGTRDESWASCRQWDCGRGRGGGCSSQVPGWSAGSGGRDEGWGARGPHMETEEGKGSAQRTEKNLGCFARSSLQNAPEAP